MHKSKLLWFLSLVSALALVLAACQPKTVIVEKEKVVTKVVKETVKETVVVKETVMVKGTPVEVTKVVEKVVTPTPTPEPKATPYPEVNIPFKNPGMLVVATIGEPESLDPAWTYETSGAGVEMQIYEPLMVFKRGSVDEYVPALATEWNISEDGKTYVFKIRKGVKFHEGGTLEPHDVAYSLQRGLLQDRADGPQWLLFDPLFSGLYTIEDLVKQEGGDLQACQKIQEVISADDDAGTVTIKLAAPFPPLFQILGQTWGSVYDKEWMVEQGAWDGTCENWRKWHDPAAEESVLFDKANGTGPYKLDHWTKGQEIVLKRNEDYWRTDPMWDGGPSGPARIETVIIKSVDEWGTRFAMAQAGDADLFYVPRQYVPQLQPLVKEEYNGTDASAPMTIINEKGGLRVFKNLPNPSSADLFFNFNINAEGGNPFIGTGKLDGNGIPPDFFSDIHVRKAFAYAFDYDTFIRDAWLGEAIRHRGPIIEGMPGYDPNSFIYEYDLKKAEEEMKQAWGGEVWEKGFYMSIAYNTGNDTRRVACELLADGLAELNPKFQVSVVNMPWPAYLAQRRSGRLPIHLTGWLEDFHHPHNWVQPYMTSAGAFSAAQHFPQEMYDRYEKLIREAWEASNRDTAEANKIYAELQKAAVDDCIDIFLVQPTGRHYEQLWIKGYYYNPLLPSVLYYTLDKVAP